MKTLGLAVPVAALALGACSRAVEPGPGDPRVSIAVAPLDVPMMTDACYELTVWNKADPDDPDAEIVWTQPTLCASRYGAEGGIRFTGICDATAPGGDNAIRLVLTDVYQSGEAPDGETLTAGTDYINPCPPPEDGTNDNGCVLTAPCTANQDSRVTFDLTVMRQATLGFFDTVVRFHDVFCAAKLDCVDDQGHDLDYLAVPGAEPPRDGPTAVLGFTCLAGDGAPVAMYLDDVVVTCTGPGGTRSSTVDPTGGPGNVTPTSVGAPTLFGAAINTGSGIQGSTYWNVLLGMNLAGPGETCTLATRGAVGEAAFTDHTTPAHTRYPVIDWDVELSANGTRVCERHPLNGDSGVGTEYTPIDAPATFDHVLGGDIVCPCWGAGTAGDGVLDTMASILAGATSVSSSHVTSSTPGNAYEVDVLQAYSEAAGKFLVLVTGMAYFALGDSPSPGLFCAWQDETEVFRFEQPLTQAEADACAADVARLADDPCAKDNGGCGSETCIYDGPGAHHCVACVTSSDCTGGAICDAGACVTPPPPSTFDVGSSPSSIVAQDFDGDGKVDVAVVNEGSGDVSVLLGNGDGTLETQVRYGVGGGHPWGLTSGDFDLDGDVDLAVSVWAEGGAGHAAILTNDGHGVFTLGGRYAFPAGGDVYQIRATDVNADGDLDLLIVTAWSRTLAVLLGESGATFGAGAAYQAGGVTLGIATGDYNGDGKVDAVVTNSDVTAPNGTANGSVRFMAGDGLGGFVATGPAFDVGQSPRGNIFMNGSWPYTMEARDMDSDGYLDAFVVSPGGFASLLYGHGDGTFNQPIQYTLPNSDVNAESHGLGLGDVDGDGKLDLVLADYNRNVIGIFAGLGGGALGTPVLTPTPAGENPNMIAMGDLNGDGKADWVVTLVGTSQVRVGLGK